MGAFNLPDQSEAQATIADYVAAVPSHQVPEAHREKVIANCVKPVLLLIEAGELAAAAGPEEVAVFVHFVRVLCTHVDLRERERHFSDLVHKLAALNRTH